MSYNTTQTINQPTLSNNKKNTTKNNFSFCQKNKNLLTPKKLDSVKNKCLPPQMNFNPWNIGKLGNYYTKISKYKEQKREDFSKFKWFMNNQTGELLKMKNISLEQTLENQVKQIQFGIQQIQKLNEDKIGLFLTLTLPPIYHSKMNNKVNKKFSEEKIQEGYKNLNKTINIIRKKINKRLGKSLPYVKIIEPHKDFTPHLHQQYWVSKEDYPKLKEYIENTIKNNIKKGILGKQYKIEKIENNDMTNISSYVSKYMIKTFETSVNPYKLREIDGWKRQNKIRMFSTSRLPIPKKLYNKITNVVEDKKDYENLGSYSIDKVKFTSIVNGKIYIRNNPKRPEFIIKREQITIDKPIELYKEETVLKWTEIYNKTYIHPKKGQQYKKEWKLVPTPKIFLVGYEYKTVYKHIETIVKNKQNVKLMDSKDWELITLEEEELESIEQFEPHYLSLDRLNKLSNLKLEDDYITIEEFDTSFMKRFIDIYPQKG